MAHIEEHLIVMKISRLIKDKGKSSKKTLADELSQETLTNLEQLTQELLGDSVIVEIEN